MCDECEQAEPLEAVYLRKANRHGWRPPAAAATAPRYRDDEAPATSPRPPLCCAAVSAAAGSR